MSVIKIKKMFDGVIIPKYIHENDSGMDIRAYLSESFCEILYPGECRSISTGVKMEIDPGYEVQVRPRSGLAINKSITVINSPGTIDSNYRGEIRVLLINHSRCMQKIEHQERIAQLVLSKVERAQIIEVDELSKTDRGGSGFGSTGSK